jgi:hypothetical protein
VERAEFVVLDFVIQPHPDGFAVARGRKIDKRNIKWDVLQEKVRDRVEGLLTKAASNADEKLSARCGMVGAVDEKHAVMASFLIDNPVGPHIMRIEDFLRSHVDKNDQGDIPENAQPNITVKVKDHKGRFVNFQVTDFTLSGPSKGDWKPFTEWY